MEELTTRNTKQFRCFSAPILDLDLLDSTEKEKHVFSVCGCEDPPILGFIRYVNLGGSGDGSVGVSGCGIISVQLAIC